MKSMTGFGRGICETESFLCQIEIKTVNSRYCDLFIKAPQVCNSFEDKIRSLVGSVIKRGKVEVFIRLTDKGEGFKTLSIDEGLVKQVKSYLVEEGFYRKKKEVPLETIVALVPDLMSIKVEPASEEEVYPLVERSLKEALEQLEEMRITEGSFIVKDLLERITTLEKELAIIEENKTGAVVLHEQRLKEKLLALLSTESIALNEDRLLQEVAIIADKTDITEEIVRFKSHMVQLKNTLQGEDVKGRKLDFLLQEVNREVNTMGSKCSFARITECVVNLKCELEKIREQVQNIE